MLEKIEDQIYFEREGISNSFLTRFDRSPAHALTEIKKTKSMEIGSLLHDMVLQYDIFESKYIIAPEDFKDAKKKEYKDFVKEHEEKQVIKYDLFKAAEKMKANILDFNFGYQLKNLLDISFTEIGCFVHDSEYDILRKSKMDLYFPEFNLIVDLKKTDDCLHFKKSIINYKYYRQDAWYSENIMLETGELPRFIFLCFEDKPPFGVMAYEIDTVWKEFGQMENRMTLYNYSFWDGSPILYNPGIQILEKPEWLR